MASTRKRKVVHLDETDPIAAYFKPVKRRAVLTELSVSQAQNRDQDQTAWVVLPRPDAKYLRQFSRISSIHEDEERASFRSVTSSQVPKGRQQRQTPGKVNENIQTLDTESSEDELAISSKTPVWTPKRKTVQPEESEFSESAKSVSSESGVEEVVTSEDESEEIISEDEVEVKASRKVNTPVKQSTTSAQSNKPAASTRASSKNMKSLLNRTKDQPRGLNLNLPPLSGIDEIFADLTSRAVDLGLTKTLQHLQNRPLRVATMCSGTESPLLALQMIQDSLKKHCQGDIQIDHLFSAEIVPYKQAYIERNFSPPIIFRDILEMTEAVNTGVPYATTAYGAKVQIPTDVDLIVVGTSCVDFSRLNSSKKGLDGGGESGKTWHAVLAFCQAFRPAIVVLENVRYAAWDTMLEQYEDIGYESAGVHVDTKDYYIPQTRQRGYMVCFSKENRAQANVTGAGKKWQTLMERFKRPASSPVSSFLLPSDKAKESLQHHDETVREVDWSQCEITQGEYRQTKRLGTARPVTNWQESGAILPPENGSAYWYSMQVERVKDTIDAATLRKALPKNGMYDTMFKTRIWNLSQNIYRDEDAQPFGISGCITPSGIFFISDSCRAMTAEESLKLQGLPLDKISFTTESPAEMQDLAGNAMSTTVVGSAILSALIAGCGALHKEHENSNISKPESHQLELACTDTNDVLFHFDVAHLSPLELIEKAGQATRRCFCEGSMGTAEKPIQQCVDCYHTTCIVCGGNPIHNYRPSRTLTLNRVIPAVFEGHLRSGLPLRLRFTELDRITATFNSMAKIREAYRTAVIASVSHDYTFDLTRRTHCWTASYRATHAHLDLVIYDNYAEWRLFAHPAKEIPCNDELRWMLDQPIATADMCEESSFGKNWNWRVPNTASTPLHIIGSGSKIASWWCRNGMPDFSDHFVWEFLDLKVAPEAPTLARDVCGRYQYLPRCGKACSSLFKRIDAKDEKPLYLFLDPTRTGLAKDDCFVFSRHKDLIEYDELRPIIGRIETGWAPWSKNGKLVNTRLFIDNSWTTVAKSRLQPVEPKLRILTPKDSMIMECATTCSTTLSLISCILPTSATNAKIQDSRIVRAEEDAFFGTHSWVFEAMRRKLPDEGWRALPTKNLESICRRCSPQRPALRWKLVDRDIKPYEDTRSASCFEQAIKSRPEPLVIQASRQPKSLQLSLGLNIASLIHRAEGRLPPGIGNTNCQWRLDTGTQKSTHFVFKPFRLRANVNVEPYTADLGMSITLFPKQQESLTWMRQQEAGCGVKFVIEESEEATIPKLGWRATVRAQAALHVRGGICADHPGFGKTITSLALIHSHLLTMEPARIVEDLESRRVGAAEGLIPTAATLIICPAVLVKQWVSEIQEKLQYSKGIISVLKTSDLARLSIADFQAAKIIVLNRTILGSDSYTEKLAAFAAVPGPATASGRSFAEWLKFATSQIPEHLKVLQNGVQKLRTFVQSRYKDNLESDAFKAVVPSRRLRGAAYIAEQGKKTTAQNSKAAARSIDTTKIHNPLFEMFFFNRIIVDEFHQFEPKEYTAIIGLKADKRWGLSATPALGDLYEIAQMAGLLGIPLRIGSDSRGIMKRKNVREIRKDLTDFELFDTMRQKPSDAMHARIYELDQIFLDTFVRQNVMDFSEMKYQDDLIPTTLDIAHRAYYTELSQHLNSLEMRIKKGIKSKAIDRQELINEAIDSSSTAEEALCKAATFFDGSKHQGIQSFILRRQDEERKILRTIRSSVSNAEQREPETFENWKKATFQNGTLGDQETIEQIRFILGDPSSLTTSSSSDVNNSDANTKPSAGKAKGNRALTAEINGMCKRLVLAKRSLRYLLNIQKVLDASSYGEVLNSACENPECEPLSTASTNVAVSAFCGHLICQGCFKNIKERAITTCPAEGCSCSMHDYHLLWSNKLGDLQNITSTNYGAKLEAMMQLLHEIQSRGDQAIVFVQFSDQLLEVEGALEDNNITAVVIKGERDAGLQVADFREAAGGKKQKTVIVLNASDETAAGLNLQNANHVIFLSPLLRDTQYGYDSTMAQAIGRVRRYGQKKGIYVYRVVALDTIDVDILEHRERRIDALTERGASKTLQPQASRKPKKPEKEGGKPERTQLVRENGEFSLRPQSWLLKHDSDEDGEGAEELEKMMGRSRVLGWEDFSSLVKFSRAFTENDD